MLVIFYLIGDIKEVNKTFSFYKNSRKAIGKDLALVEGGYDHCYCLEKSDNGFCARYFLFSHFLRSKSLCMFFLMQYLVN